MKSLTALSIENSTVTCSNLAGAQNSLYSIDTNNAGTVVAAGGTEKHIRARVKAMTGKFCLIANFEHVSLP